MGESLVISLRRLQIVAVRLAELVLALALALALAAGQSGAGSQAHRSGDHSGVVMGVFYGWTVKHHAGTGAVVARYSGATVPGGA
jgi:hypothetical protein